MFVRSVQILLQFDKILWRSAIFWIKYFVVLNLSVRLKS